MIKFLQQNDTLSNLLNEKCNILYNVLPAIDLNSLSITDEFKKYFIKSHLSRPNFTLECSAAILYNSIKKCNKPLHEIVLMDYGAGLGTLYILAKMIGVGKVIYNDLLQDFLTPAIVIDKALGVTMDEYILGDVEDTCKQLLNKNIHCDIITSRNVLEHIYDLSHFFNIIYKYQPKAIIYNSTTANWNNPAAHLQHIYLHKKYRKGTLTSKEKIIKETIKDISETDAKKLANALVAVGGKDWDNALLQYKQTKKIPKSKKKYTNTCNVDGYWNEHLIPFKKYRSYAKDYLLEFKPGFWDTHYSSKLKNIFAKFMNTLNGITTTSFIYIIAIPKK